MTMRLLLIFGLAAGWLIGATPARAFHEEAPLRSLQASVDGGGEPDYGVADNGGGKTLAEAIEQVRRQTKGRILSAETRVVGNREMHFIKVLTRDGKVQTKRVKGRRVDK
jgi:hypothetical protein